MPAIVHTYASEITFYFFLSSRVSNFIAYTVHVSFNVYAKKNLAVGFIAITASH